jgi:hypothetical protein
VSRPARTPAPLLVLRMIGFLMLVLYFWVALQAL